MTFASRPLAVFRDVRVHVKVALFHAIRSHAARREDFDGEEQGLYVRPLEPLTSNRDSFWNDEDVRLRNRARLQFEIRR